jgi:hypothetical protein
LDLSLILDEPEVVPYYFRGVCIPPLNRAVLTRVQWDAEKSLAANTRKITGKKKLRTMQLIL